MSDSTQLEVLENILKKRHQSSDSKDSTKGGGGGGGDGRGGSSQVSANSASVTLAASREASSSIRPDIMHPAAYLPITHSNAEAFIDDDVLRGALESGHYCVSIANQDVTELPIGLGEAHDG